MRNFTMDIYEKNEYDVGNDNFVPNLTAYLPQNRMDNVDGEDRRRPTILVCPGGGYSMTSDREAEPVALAFVSAGYNAFVLRYSVSPKKHPQPICDAAKAMSIIRSNAEQWNVDKNKIAIIGFSAGGHLAGSLGVHWDKPWLHELLGVDGEQIKPNAAILSYAVLSSGKAAHSGSFENLVGRDEELLELMSIEKQVGKHTPPSFLWHTFDDNDVNVNNTLSYASAMEKIGVPCEVHIFPKGVHGLSLATEETSNGIEDLINPSCAVWMDLCIKWLKNTL